jgi:hypothetical protein
MAKNTDPVTVTLTVEEWREVCESILAQAQRFEALPEQKPSAPEQSKQLWRDAGAHLRTLSGKIIDHGWC